MEEEAVTASWVNDESPNWNLLLKNPAIDSREYIVILEEVDISIGILT